MPALIHTIESVSHRTGSSSKVSDRERGIISQIASGRKDLFTDLLLPYEEALKATARRLCAQPADAEDVLQQLRLKALKALPNFRGDSTMRTWLTSILINEVRMLRRKRSNWRELGTDDLESRSDCAEGGPGILDSICTRETEQEIWQLVGKLPEKYRVVVHLRFTMDADVEQTGAMLKISHAAVKSRQHRALKMLRAYFKHSHNGRMLRAAS